MLNDLVRRCQTIQAACGGDPAQQVAAAPGENLDDFTVLKKGIAAQLKSIRENIKERNELNEKQPGSKTIIEMSQRIRQGLLQVKEDAKRLSAMQRQQAQKGKKKNAGAEDAETARRAETVDLIWQHIQEVENLDRARFARPGSSAPGARAGSTRSAMGASAAAASSARAGGANASSREQLMRGARRDEEGGAGAGRAGARGGASSAAAGGAGGSGGDGGSDDPTQSDLPDIDVDAMMAQQGKNQMKIDRELDEVSKGVAQLHQIALDMQDELKTQNVLIDDLTKKMTDANVHLYHLNKKMKKTLDEVRKGDRFIMDIILICVILGIGGYLYQEFNK